VCCALLAVEARRTAGGPKDETGLTTM
jgi:hypothetical protein